MKAPRHIFMISLIIYWEVFYTGLISHSLPKKPRLHPSNKDMYVLPCWVTYWLMTRKFLHNVNYLTISNILQLLSLLRVWHLYLLVLMRSLNQYKSFVTYISSLGDRFQSQINQKQMIQRCWRNGGGKELK